MGCVSCKKNIGGVQQPVTLVPQAQRIQEQVQSKAASDAKDQNDNQTAEVHSNNSASMSASQVENGKQKTAIFYNGNEDTLSMTKKKSKELDHRFQITSDEKRAKAKAASKQCLDSDFSDSDYERKKRKDSTNRRGRNRRRSHSEGSSMSSSSNNSQNMTGKKTNLPDSSIEKSQKKLYKWNFNNDQNLDNPGNGGRYTDQQNLSQSNIQQRYKDERQYQQTRSGGGQLHDESQSDRDSEIKQQRRKANQRQESDKRHGEGQHRKRFSTGDKSAKRRRRKHRDDEDETSEEDVSDERASKSDEESMLFLKNNQIGKLNDIPSFVDTSNENLQKTKNRHKKKQIMGHKRVTARHLKKFIDSRFDGQWKQYHGDSSDSHNNMIKHIRKKHKASTRASDQMNKISRESEQQSKGYSAIAQSRGRRQQQPNSNLSDEYDSDELSYSWEHENNPKKKNNKLVRDQSDSDPISQYTMPNSDNVVSMKSGLNKSEHQFKMKKLKRNQEHNVRVKKSKKYSEVDIESQNQRHLDHMTEQNYYQHSSSESNGKITEYTVQYKSRKKHDSWSRRQRNQQNFPRNHRDRRSNQHSDSRSLFSQNYYDMKSQPTTKPKRKKKSRHSRHRRQQFDGLMYEHQQELHQSLVYQENDNDPISVNNVSKGDKELMKQNSNPVPQSYQKKFQQYAQNESMGRQSQDSEHSMFLQQIIKTGNSVDHVGTVEIKNVPQEYRTMYMSYCQQDNNSDNYFAAEQLVYYQTDYKKELEQYQDQNMQMVKRFTLSDKIGSGSFGNVYKALDEIGRQIAVKQTPLSQLGPTQDMQQKKIMALQTEIEILSTLRHPNIVSYLGSQKDDQNLNVFLEYVPDGTLQDLTKKFDIDENLAAFYAKEILLGLEYLHYNNILHRDIKSANILYLAQGKLLLADFGSSKHVQQDKNQTAYSKSFCGTPYWMAPEVIRQSGHNRFADIWSLGCTVYELVAKRPPWQNDQASVYIVLNQIAETKKPPKYPDGISKELKDFLDCCFQSEPKRRANVFELLRHPFIRGKKLTTPLGHIDSRNLAIIQETQSQYSGASPFGLSQNSQQFFDSKKITGGNKSFAKKSGQNSQLNINSNKMRRAEYNHASPILDMQRNADPIENDMQQNKSAFMSLSKADNSRNVTSPIINDNVSGISSKRYTQQADSSNGSRNISSNRSSPIDGAINFSTKPRNSRNLAVIDESFEEEFKQRRDPRLKKKRKPSRIPETDGSGSDSQNVNNHYRSPPQELMNNQMGRQRQSNMSNNIFLQNKSKPHGGALNQPQGYGPPQSRGLIKQQSKSEKNMLRQNSTDPKHAEQSRKNFIKAIQKGESAANTLNRLQEFDELRQKKQINSGNKGGTSMYSEEVVGGKHKNHKNKRDSMSPSTLQIIAEESDAACAALESHLDNPKKNNFLGEKAASQSSNSQIGAEKQEEAKKQRKQLEEQLANQMQRKKPEKKTAPAEVGKQDKKVKKRKMVPPKIQVKDSFKNDTQAMSMQDISQKTVESKQPQEGSVASNMSQSIFTDQTQNANDVRLRQDTASFSVGAASPEKVKYSLTDKFQDDSNTSVADQRQSPKMKISDKDVAKPKKEPSDDSYSFKMVLQSKVEKTKFVSFNKSLCKDKEVTDDSSSYKSPVASMNSSALNDLPEI